MENKTQVYEVTHSSPEFKTVADYIRDPSSPAHEYIKDMDSFLSVLHKDEKTTNRQAIEAGYKKKWEVKKYKGKDASQLFLPIGTKLAIETNKSDRGLGLLTQGIEVVNNDIPAFKARALAELELDKRYRPTSKPIGGKLQGKTNEEYPDVTVWMWCRALSNTSKNEGRILNLTPFIQKVTTNVDKNGGNFQLSLPPLVCEIGDDGKWIIKKKSLQNYTTSKNKSLQGDGYVAEASLFKIGKDGGLKRNEFFFHNVISSNDMIWIRFETLDVEKDQRLKDNKDLFIDKSNLAGRIYDMIGLVDINTITTNPQDNDVNISINGRDLSKLFIEDGSYFYALEMSQGQLNFAGGSTQQNSLMQRVFSNNALQYFNSYFNNSIENVLKFVVQQLSTIKVVPDNLFTSYGDRRNKKFNEGAQSKQLKAQQDNLSSTEKKAKEAIKSIRVEAQLTDADPYVENKEVDTIWRSLLHFMENLRSQKVREENGSNTTGWRSFVYTTISGAKENIIENTLPQYFFSNLHVTLYYTKAQVFKINEKTLFNNLDKYLDLKESQPQNKELWTEDLANGIWQIIKLVIDDGVTRRRIVDSSMSSANGSLLNYIRKVCQEPFVEFYMDTYGDTYNLIVRKPPYDKEGVTSMLKGQYSVEKEEGKQTKVTSTVIDIEPEDVLKEELSYDDRSAITWYQLMPQANFIGNSSTYSLAYLPAVFFEEYADIWGSRPMQCVHNYLPYLSLNPSETTLDVCEKQAFEDLKYIIESNAYLPFTRRGTLSLNGDRRLKIGNIVRYKSTGEIFFIDHVQQIFAINETSIDRSSVIQVSRGMKEVLINGIAAIERELGEEESTFSYFDIVNTKLNDIIETERVEISTEKVQVGVKRESQVKGEIDNLFTNINKYKGYKWALGTSGEGGRIDCSGFVSKVLQLSGVKIARTTAEEIMKKSKDFRPVAFFDAATLQEGDVIGLNAQLGAGGKTYGIDHIAIVVRNINTGQLELAESASKVGVRSKPLSEVLPRYNKISKYGKYVGNFRIVPTEVIETPIYETKTSTIKTRDIDRSKVFSNFRVFKSCFNFFLKRRMNDDRLVSNLLEEISITGNQNINRLSNVEIEEFKNTFKIK